MTATASPPALLRRWQRLHLRVRCALAPDRTALVAQYVLCGNLLSRRGVLAPLVVQQRMLRTLLQTAHDDALPGAWRRACVEQAAQPLARLSALLRLHDPLAWQAWQCAVELARRAVPAGAQPRPVR